MMIDKHKRLLPPCNKGFTTHLESMYNTSFTLVGTSGLAPCRLGVPRPMSFYMSKLSGSIPFHINKRSSSFYYGKNTGYQFIPYYIDNSHFRFSVCLSSDVIFTQLRIKVNSCHSCQMQHSFNLLVGNGTYLCFPVHTRSGLILKRSDAGITCKFPPVNKTSKIIGVHYQKRCNDKPDAFNGCDQLERAP